MVGDAKARVWKIKLTHYRQRRGLALYGEVNHYQLSATADGGMGMGYEEIERRYPLLIAAMKWAAILCTTEAVDCIRAIKERRGSGEAVSHFGGPVAVFNGAMRCRKYARQLRQSRKAA